MSVKTGELGSLFVQQESVLAGSGTGSIYEMPVVDFSFEPVFGRRATRIGFIRQAIGQSVENIWYQGKIEFEFNAIEAVRLFLRSMFELHSISMISGTEYGYRFPRLGSENVDGLKIFAHYEGGPYLRFDGVAVDQMRVTVRNRAISRLTVNWLALVKVESETDPELSTVAEGRTLASGDGALIQIDETTFDQSIEATVEFRNNARPSGFRSGVPTAYVRSPYDVTGSLVEYFDDSFNLPLKVQELTESALMVRTESQSSADDYLQINIPRAVFESGSASPKVAGDSSETVSFRGLENAGVGSEQTEVLLSVA